MEHPCKYIVVREGHLSQMNLGKCEDYLGLRKPEPHHIAPIRWSGLKGKQNKRKYVSIICIQKSKGLGRTFTLIHVSVQVCSA